MGRNPASQTRREMLESIIEIGVNRVLDQNTQLVRENDNLKKQLTDYSPQQDYKN
jgi:hypothetical protein